MSNLARLSWDCSALLCMLLSGLTHAFTANWSLMASFPWPVVAGCRPGIGGNDHACVSSSNRLVQAHSHDTGWGFLRATRDDKLQCASSFQASLCHTVHALLAKASHISKPWLKEQRNRLHLLIERSAIKCKGACIWMGRLCGPFYNLTHTDTFSSEPGHWARTHVKVWMMSILEMWLVHVGHKTAY